MKMNYNLLQNCNITTDKFTNKQKINNMEELTKKDPTKINAYSLHIVWNNGKKEALTTLPPYVINSIENYLDALEEEFKGS